MNESRALFQAYDAAVGYCPPILFGLPDGGAGRHGHEYILFDAVDKAVEWGLENGFVDPVLDASLVAEAEWIRSMKRRN